MKKTVSLMMLMLILTGMLILVFDIKPIKAVSWAIAIRADGSIDSPTAPISTTDNITYTLTDNITFYYDGIIIQRSNIVLDGAGYTIHCFYGQVNLDRGIGLWGDMRNVRVQNIQIDNFFYGILIAFSSENNITGCNITNNRYGVALAESTGNTFYHNNFIGNTHQIIADGGANIWDDKYPSGGNYWDDYTGADLYSGPYQNETGSDGIGDTYFPLSFPNVDNYPLMNPWSSLPVHNVNTGLGYTAIQDAISASETLDGHTIFVEAGTYYENPIVNKTLSLLGENRSLTVIHGYVSVQTNNVQFKGFSVEANISSSGITLSHSNNSIVSDNKITSKNWAGIVLSEYSNNNTISNNIIVDSEYGVNIGFFGGSPNYNNTISNNLIADNTIGIEVCTASTGNKIFGNTVEGNSDGGILILDADASGNEIYHNRILHNGDIWHRNAEDLSSNTWDNSYPSGGNYWSDYNGTDVYSGPCQNETGSDGIGDTPYVVDENNQDRYPHARVRGDLNQDGIVNILDAIQAASAFGLRAGDPGWNEQADINLDGLVNVLDVIILASNFGKH